MPDQGVVIIIILHLVTQLQLRLTLILLLNPLGDRIRSGVRQRLITWLQMALQAMCGDVLAGLKVLDMGAVPIAIPALLPAL
jgi:hypothetical protein